VRKAFWGRLALRWFFEPSLDSKRSGVWVPSFSNPHLLVCCCGCFSLFAMAEFFRSFMFGALTLVRDRRRLPWLVLLFCSALMVLNCGNITFSVLRGFACCVGWVVVLMVRVVVLVVVWGWVLYGVFCFLFCGVILLVVVGRVGLVFVLVLVVVVFVWLVVVGGACGWVCDPLGRWLECWRRLVREGWWLLWLLD